MKDNDYKDKLLYIKNYRKNEKDKLRIDFIMKMIDDVGLDKINDIIIEDNKAIIIFRHNIIDPEKIIYNKITNATYGVFVLESQISFNLSSVKINVLHQFYYKTRDSYIHIRGKTYQNVYKVYNDNNKNTVLYENINTCAFDMEIPDYLNYIYNISENIEKELMELKILKENILDFIKNDYTGMITKIEHNRSIELINNFFNVHEFLTKDNLYDFMQLSTHHYSYRLSTHYSYRYYVPYIDYFYGKIFDNFLSRF